MNLNKSVLIFYPLFSISLPFNGNEIDILGIPRFEIKITMITFILLFAAWLLVTRNNYIKNIKYEKSIYSLFFIYACSQYLSLINSKFPLESLSQSIIITFFIIMTIICSQMIIEKKTLHYVVISMAFISIILSFLFFINHYFIYSIGRAGTGLILFGLEVRGDPIYLADILLFGLGPCYYLIFHFFRKNVMLTIPFQIIYFSSFAITHSKGVLFSVFTFFIVSIILFKSKRKFFMLSSILLIVTIIVNISLKHYSIGSGCPGGCKSESDQRIIEGSVILNNDDIEEIFKENTNIEKYVSSFTPNKWNRVQKVTIIDEEFVREEIVVEDDDVSYLKTKIQINISELPEKKAELSEEQVRSIESIAARVNLSSEQVFEKLQEVKISVQAIAQMHQEKISIAENKYAQSTYTFANYIYKLKSDRLNIFGNLGMSSYHVRVKALMVSFINSLPYIWFGNGAGTSQKLLPEMAEVYDKTMLKMNPLYELPYSNITVIDSHNLFFTELFNVGLIGSLSLILVICLILYKQIKLINKNNKNNNRNIMNILLFSSLLSLLSHRMFNSFVAIPFLWFYLGLILGTLKLQYNSNQT